MAVAADGQNTALSIVGCGRKVGDRTGKAKPPMMAKQPMMMVQPVAKPVAKPMAKI